MIHLIPEFKLGGPYGFLSNFYAHPFVYDGVEWPTAEHAFQSRKTDDPELRDAIRTAPTPAAAKRVGRAVTPLPEGWDERGRYHAMAEVLVAKFSIPELEQALLATEKAWLMEGNRHGDTFWGCVYRNGAWYGKNTLGIMLMAQRDMRRKS